MLWKLCTSTEILQVSSFGLWFVSVVPSNTAKLYWVVDASGLQVESSLLP